MNKNELVEAICGKVTAKKLDKATVKEVLDAAIETIQETLVNGGTVQLIGFGTFKVNHRAARTGHNPKTGASIEIPASSVPAFQAGKSLKDAVNVSK